MTPAKQSSSPPQLPIHTEEVRPSTRKSRFVPGQARSTTTAASHELKPSSSAGQVTIAECEVIPDIELESRPATGFGERPARDTVAFETSDHEITGLDMRSETPLEMRPATGFETRPTTELETRPTTGLETRPTTGLLEMEFSCNFVITFYCDISNAVLSSLRVIKTKWLPCVQKCRSFFSGLVIFEVRLISAIQRDLISY